MCVCVCVCVRVCVYEYVYELLNTKIKKTLESQSKTNNRCFQEFGRFRSVVLYNWKWQNWVNYLKLCRLDANCCRNWRLNIVPCGIARRRKWQTAKKRKMQNQFRFSGEKSFHLDTVSSASVKDTTCQEELLKITVRKLRKCSVHASIEVKKTTCLHNRWRGKEIASKTSSWRTSTNYLNTCHTV